MQIDIVEVYKIGGAIVGIALFIIAGYKLYDKLVDKLAALETRVDNLEKKHDNDVNKIRQELQSEVKRLNKENLVIIKALKGCLDGLQQLNCNGEVSEAKDMIIEHLNNMAHSRGQDE